MKPILIILAVASLAGCAANVRPCKKGTLFVTITFGGDALTADTIDAQISVDGGTPVSGSAARPANLTSGTIEYDFPGGYPTGKSVTVTITAKKGGNVVALGSGTITLPASSCGTLKINVTSANGNDLAMTLGDLAGLDLAGLDLAGLDQAVSMGGGLDGGADMIMSMMGDMANAAGPDLSGPTLAPSHVLPSFYHPAAANLSAVTIIDTTSLSLMPPAAAGVDFAADANGNAVLSVGSWTVDVDVTVSGKRPLVVVAAGAVTINHTIHAEAKLSAPGPGGANSGGGLGAGAAGWTFGADSGSGGGGGASFGTVGGKGGDTGNSDMAVHAGMTYGNLMSDFVAGSGGGACVNPDCQPNGVNSNGPGGAGGGALQITSAVSISFGAGGVINAGGGGGTAGCYGGGGGGGGGSGGMIFLEAPSITLGATGAVAANGGGGGGGGDATGGAMTDGEDAKSQLAAAAGGMSMWGPGGTGAFGTTLAAGGTPSTTCGGCAGGGGGGGGTGRIWLRTRGAPATYTIVTPPPNLDTTF